MKKVKWTDEVIEFMKCNYKGKDNVELAQLLNEKFNLNTNADRVSNVKANLKRRKGLDLTTGINRGCIKKGNIPQNHREVGSERINVNGYWEIKVLEPNKWELKHRVIYKQNFGDIPKNCKVIFADGNKNNLELNNLILTTNAEELHLNKRGLRFQDKELTETGLNIVKLSLKIGDINARNK